MIGTNDDTQEAIRYPWIERTDLETAHTWDTSSTMVIAPTVHTKETTKQWHDYDDITLFYLFFETPLTRAHP